MLRRNLSTIGVTHEVFNQAKPLVNFNLYKSEPISFDVGEKHFNQKINCLFSNYGKSLGSSNSIVDARTAEKNKPVLKQFDDYGRRIDVIEYHESYHRLMKRGLDAGTATFSIGDKNEVKNRLEPGTFVARTIMYYMEASLEPGHCCPITMTAACVPAIETAKDPYYSEILSKLCVKGYDGRDVPISEKSAITAGMSLTEKQGGSDVRANTTTAVYAPELSDPGSKAYKLTGHKWFTSAPMSDIFLTLAKTSPDSPPSCFVVPRWLSNGSRNQGFRVMRLKDKLGDRSNASSEVEYQGAVGTLLGEEGKGVKQIMEMVQATRLDCVIGSSSGMRRALQHALVHAASRNTFGRTLIQHPLMENLLADLCIEVEVNTLMTFYLSFLYDAANCGYNLGDFTEWRGFKGEKEGFEVEGGGKEKELFRIAVAVSKYWITKRQPHFTYECMEALGGNGFVEDFPLAYLFRHSPLNSIWEGSGNIIALDILRASKLLPLLLKDIKLATGKYSHFDDFVRDLEIWIGKLLKNQNENELQRNARKIADLLALALQSSVVIRFGDVRVAEAFLSKEKYGEVNYGSFNFKTEDAKYIIERNMPVFY